MRAKLIASIVMGAVLLVAAAAQADSGSFANSQSVACGTRTSYYWNAPAGSTVYTRSNGPIAAVIDAVGEYRTHTLLSHGTAWTSHSTTAMGQARYKCDEVVDQYDLANGYPGAARVSMKGIREALYGDGAPTFISYQAGTPTAYTTAGANISNFFYNAMADPATLNSCVSTVAVASAKNAAYTNQIYRYKWPVDEQAQHPGASGGYMWYRINEYVNGVDGNKNLAGSCSQFVAYSQKKALGVGYEMTTPTYDQASVDYGKRQLWTRIKTECETKLATYWWGKIAVGLSSLVCSVACFPVDIGDNMCERLATQTVYCFTSDVGGDNCANGCHYASDAQNKPVGSAKSISPDRIAGYGRQCTGTGCSGYTTVANGAKVATGCGSPNSGHSIWGCQAYATPTWTSAGSLYACWF
ncbi:MAG: hypothetical protein HY906_27805 [Deltaproteobacteria bacterium]|nr:hypothetical protein [Deltaproteobacteria bacterium]